ncbi:MAG TPA: fatty acid desaturase [Gammaproteobacteria bacterium]|nr:fatty acid desaturase [Gammaproteobacteria bacterium]
MPAPESGHTGLAMTGLAAVGRLAVDAAGPLLYSSGPAIRSCRGIPLSIVHGLLDAPLWVYVIVTAVFMHITITAVTLYLHRDQTHRGLDLHPAVQHFFRFWLWMTTGMVTREWVAVHRKHHAHCETEDDPHSPKIRGLRKVLFEGAELYREEASNPETVEKYGRGTPEDWMERHVYRPHSKLGILFMFLIDVALFGALGITIWAVQMATIPFLAAGVVNGLGHHSGYRNFECKDAATNVSPWGVVLCGEELHNNHHAFPSSAKFALRPWEIDLGWWYIRAFQFFGLAKVRRVAPTPVITPARHVDLETVRAVIVNRLHVLRHYSRDVMRPVLAAEKARAGAAGRALLARARRILTRDEALLDAGARVRLQKTLAESQTLKTVYEFRQRLQALWENRTLSNESLLEQFKEWCTQAEATGISKLREFAGSLRRYAPQHPA